MLAAGAGASGEVSNVAVKRQPWPSFGEDAPRVRVDLALPRDASDARIFEALIDATDAGEDGSNFEHGAAMWSV